MIRIEYEEKTNKIKQLCKDIENNFIQLGKELIEIRDKELYKEKYRDFDRYIDTEFSFGHSQAYKFMKVAQTYSLESDTPHCGLGITRLYLLTFVPKLERDIIIKEAVEEKKIPPLKEIQDRVKRFNPEPVNQEAEIDTEEMRLDRELNSMITILEDFTTHWTDTKVKAKALYDNSVQFQKLDQKRDIMVKLVQNIKG